MEQGIDAAGQLQIQRREPTDVAVVRLIVTRFQTLHHSG